MVSIVMCIIHPKIKRTNLLKTVRRYRIFRIVHLIPA